MATEVEDAAQLLSRADAERTAGHAAAAADLYEAAVEAARDSGDLDAMARAALGLASMQVFGTAPGRLPALLHDVLQQMTENATRARLAAALARCWVYAGEAARARAFADEAVARARSADDPALVADALDAALSASWGPDEHDRRRDLARQLDDVAAHVADTEARLKAHLWGLQVACESLDVHAMHRQMRSLEILAAESPRARFFAASRRLMLDLVRARHDTAPQLLELARQAGEDARLPDAFMVLGTLSAYAGLQDGDLVAVATTAGAAEQFAVTEAVTVVHAEAAFLWAAAGHLDRAEALLRTFRGGSLAALARDQDWLLTLQLVLEVALAVDDEQTVREATALLEPYAGRAVVNAGAVCFHGVTDDPLSRALHRLGRAEEGAALRASALATYERIGAQWWSARLQACPVPSAVEVSPRAARLHPTSGGLWAIGAEATPVAGLRGFGYLRTLLRQPGHEHRALDLAGQGHAVVEEHDLGEIVDKQALAAYRQRLADLQEDLEEAEQWDDTGRAGRARAERDALLEELSRATGLGSRGRVTGSSQERARVAVKKAISTAIARIADVDDQLADHLRRSVQTGLLCSYDPEPGTAPTWLLDV